MKVADSDVEVESLEEWRRLSKEEEEMLTLAEKCLRTARVYSLLEE